MITIPLIFLVTAGLFPVVRKGYGIFTTIMFVIAFICAMLNSVYTTCSQELTQFPWFRAGDFNFHVTIQADLVTKILLPFVTLIGSLVSLYSTSYFKGSNRQSEFFSLLALFMFSMTGLILSGNLLLIFIFWELVGICSYLLIGYYRDKTTSGIAATKALIINKIGDIGFLIALVAFISGTGSSDLTGSTAGIGEINTYLISIGLLVAATAKSAQFPLHTWLPDAMAGPSPVSALIHSATMVAAGIYLLFRTRFLFPEEILLTAGIIGLITAVIGAFNALFETKIKQLLAWSTMSQLGLMMMSVAIGSPGAAIMHLISHGFFKAGLFLTAGNLLKEVNNTSGSDLEAISEKQGGNKFTAVAVIIFSLGLVGVPLTAAFISKEAIAAQLPVFAGISFFFVSGLTILYTVRLSKYIFPFLKSSSHKAFDGASLSILTLLLFTGWWIWSPWPAGTVDYFRLSKAPSDELTLFSALFVLIILALSFIIFTRHRHQLNRINIRKIDPDPLYKNAFLTPVLKISEFAGKADHALLDYVIHAIAVFQVITAHLIAAVDRILVDGAAHLIAGTARYTGILISRISKGNVRSYLWWSMTILITLLIILS